MRTSNTGALPQVLAADCGVLPLIDDYARAVRDGDNAACQVLRRTLVASLEQMTAEQSPPHALRTEVPRAERSGHPASPEGANVRTFDTAVLDAVREAGTLLTEICHQNSLAAGWWTHRPTGLDLTQVISAPEDSLQQLLGGALVAQKLCLTHSEISEGMEGHRKGLKDDKLPHRSMLEVELADAVIRICDLVGALRLDLGGAIAEKLAYNRVRPDHKPDAREAAGGKAY